MSSLDASIYKEAYMSRVYFDFCLRFIITRPREILFILMMTVLVVHAQSKNGYISTMGYGIFRNLAMLTTKYAFFMSQCCTQCHYKQMWCLYFTSRINVEIFDVNVSSQHKLPSIKTIIF